LTLNNKIDFNYIPLSSWLFVVSVRDQGHLFNNKRIGLSSEVNLKLGFEFVMRNIDVSLTDVLL
jgi:hypothetical protein